MCVDLDGTLLKSDMLWESVLCLLRRNPLSLFRIPFWLMRGRARLKDEIVRRVIPDVQLLPYHAAFLGFLRQEHARGREILLTTASHHTLARKVADHLQIFSDVIGSDDLSNLKGRHKAARLKQRFEGGGFHYAGDSKVDLEVWAEASGAIVVSGNNKLIQRVRDIVPIELIFGRERSFAAAALFALRPHQWVKNLIVFVPLITSHTIAQWNLLADAVLAFLAFSLCASGTYIFNDLLDVDADRQHPTKRRRPFAQGDLPIPFGLVLSVVLPCLSVFVLMALPSGVALALGCYLILTIVYSWWAKRVALLDVFCLATLYTIRLIAGHEAARVQYSAWLLVFSMFIFLSLALVKRFQELLIVSQPGDIPLRGRGYVSSDVPLVSALGSASGFMAVLVLALYVNSDQVRALYRQPLLLLLVCPLLLFWVSRVWMLVHRGRIPDDPVVFAVKDPVSYLIGVLSVVVILLAKVA